MKCTDNSYNIDWRTCAIKEQIRSYTKKEMIEDSSLNQLTELHSRDRELYIY